MGGAADVQMVHFSCNILYVLLFTFPIFSQNQNGLQLFDDNGWPVDSGSSLPEGGTRLVLEIGYALNKDDKKSGKPFVSVTEESYVWNTNSLIGTVGGTLGLFIGFSFHGTFDWVLDKIVWLFSTRQNKQKNKAMRLRGSRILIVTVARK